MELTSKVQLALGPKVTKLLSFDMMAIVGIEVKGCVEGGDFQTGGLIVREIKRQNNCESVSQ